MDTQYDDKMNEIEFDEPEEGDYTTGDHIHFYQYGKLVVTAASDESDWQDAVSCHMEDEQFWPNVWFISDHGNAHLMSLSE